LQRDQVQGPHVGGMIAVCGFLDVRGPAQLRAGGAEVTLSL
jgi:hypothetical protein